MTHCAPQIPKVLLQISEHLSSHKFRISTLNHDGRINSAVNEDEVLNYLERSYDFGSYELIRPQARDWFDFAIEKGTEFYPVNIKVTTTDTVDNLNCKLGIYYALTGLKPSFSNGISWLPFFSKLHDSFGKYKDKDYYFLIVNKNNLNDVFCSSLKGITNLTPNGNNLPFQSKWSDNHKLTYRTFEQASNFIMSTFATSIKLRSDIYFNFKRFFPEYV
jgi:hypothetical protein